MMNFYTWANVLIQTTVLQPDHLPLKLEDFSWNLIPPVNTMINWVGSPVAIWTRSQYAPWKFENFHLHPRWKRTASMISNISVSSWSSSSSEVLSTSRMAFDWFLVSLGLHRFFFKLACTSHLSALQALPACSPPFCPLKHSIYHFSIPFFHRQSSESLAIGVLEWYSQRNVVDSMKALLAFHDVLEYWSHFWWLTLLVSNWGNQVLLHQALYCFWKGLQTLDQTGQGPG